MWKATRTTNGDVHVRPTADLIRHGDDDCPCGPAVEPVPRPDGSMAWMYSHHSLDNQEDP